MLKILLFILVCIICIEAKNEDYKGYKVYNIKFETQSQADRFQELQSDLVDFWKKPSLKHHVVGRAMVPPSHFDWFEGKISELHIQKDVYIEDVFEYLNKAEKGLQKTTRNDSVFSFDGYYRYNDILDHMHRLKEATINSNVSVNLEEFSITEEGRPIIYLKIGQRAETNTEKLVVIIEAGLIPREWITISAALNLVNKILDNTQFLATADWIIIPVLNPDGYEYTHTNLRLWQKSMSTKSEFGFICPGVNLNRNFNVSWLNSDSSTSPCSHLYAGIEPFSENETQLIKHLVEEYNSRITLYISLQNDGFVSYPWRFERAASGMYRQHHLLALDMVEAMGDKYLLDVGWSALGGRVSGTSTDYAQQSGVLYSYNIGLSAGNGEVIIPEEEISSVIEDVWRAVAVAAENLL